MGNYRLELIILGLLAFILIVSDNYSSLRSADKNQSKQISKLWSEK